jgi:hypothetical protein
MATITASVGQDGVNGPADVRVVQQLLQNNMSMLTPLRPPGVTGLCDRQTILLITEFQERTFRASLPDVGRVEPNSRTWQKLNEPPDADDDLPPELHEALRVLDSEATSFGVRFINDGRLRKKYAEQIAEAAEEIKAKFRSGNLSAGEAAEEAQQMRNTIMEATRLKTSDIGRAVAEAEKGTGKTLEELLAKYANEKFQRPFRALSKVEQDAVYGEIVAASGRASPKFMAKAARWGKAGKGLLILSLAIAVYNVATADDKLDAAGKEAAGMGGGFLGGAAAGAVAGLACGPGAPVCVTIFVFVGGALGALGADIAYDHIMH